MSNSEIQELQSRLAYQEDTLAQLNTMVARQDRQIQELVAALKSVAQKYDDLMFEREQSQGVVDEKPPHY
ncbi:SlyX family protein [Gilvimarinus sp. SDUM040013]|uniref:SlyX family protein n=1 Tax=Gilvimarinus gilvus TaxID=3058038 RepID=A0ABU4RYQ5_9GAMM|nr:SlyX family protein [Gilvimarinus sp. SDUM040013]MDO3386310.1 SlyX family protein [Gilvimarinus sp. SDUM040013]MDX6850032.1 SlyX family protein [Gilvimarinus sp. SDUM040013]